MGCGNSNIDDNKSRKIKINDYLTTLSKSVVKINYSDKIFYGFFLKLLKEDKDFYCILTNNENITEQMIDEEEILNISYDNNSKTKKNFSKYW